jgi:hypothetical protein
MAATLRIRSITCIPCLRNKKLRICVQNAPQSGQCKTITLCPNGNSQPINLSFRVEGKICFYQIGESEPIYTSYPSVSPLQSDNRTITLQATIQQAGGCELRLSYRVTPNQNVLAFALDFVVLSATTLIRYIGDFLSTLFVLLFSRSQLEEQDPLIEDTVTPPEEPSTEIPTETSTEQTPPPEDSSPKDSDL